RRIDERGVAQAVEQHPIAAAGECGDCREVRHVAGREEERPLPTGECGERLLEALVLDTMAGHEMRGAAADAPVAGRIAKRGADGWMPAQTQIVVAAKVDEPPALDHDLRRIRPGARKFRETLHRSARAPEMLPPGSREGVRERSGTGSSRAASLGRVAGSGSVER